MEPTSQKKFEQIAGLSTRSEKTSWNRKLDNMVKAMAELKPIEDKILDILQSEKQPLMDKIDGMRQTMVRECVHPIEYLTEVDEHVVCKFCNRKFAFIDEEK